MIVCVCVHSPVLCVYTSIYKLVFLTLVCLGLFSLPFICVLFPSDSFLKGLYRSFEVIYLPVLPLLLGHEDFAGSNNTLYPQHRA